MKKQAGGTDPGGGDYRILIGTGGIGSGIFFQLEGDHSLGRDESRPGVLLDSRDFCKLHIIEHYVAALLGPAAGGDFRTVALGRVGADGTGEQLMGQMEWTGIETSRVRVDPEAATMFSVCFQYPDSSGGNITASNSASARVRPEDIRASEDLLASHAGRGIALAAPEVPLESRLELLRLARHHAFLTVSALTSAEMRDPGSDALLALTDILVLNRDEAQALSGVELDRVGLAWFQVRLAEKLLSLNPDIRIGLTLGAAGSVGFEKGAWESTPALPVTAISTAGAGDATTAGVIVSQVAGLPFILPGRRSPGAPFGELSSGMDFAALVASFSVTSKDTIHLGASRRALRDHASGLGLKLAPALAGLLAE